MRQAFTDCCKRECEAWQKTIERLEGEDKLCLKNGREVLADNIGLGKVSKTENEFDEFLNQFYGRLPGESRVVKY